MTEALEVAIALVLRLTDIMPTLCLGHLTQGYANTRRNPRGHGLVATQMSVLEYLRFGCYLG